MKVAAQIESEFKERFSYGDFYTFNKVLKSLDLIEVRRRRRWH